VAKVVWKYPITSMDCQIWMPKGADILSCSNQNDPQVFFPLGVKEIKAGPPLLLGSNLISMGSGSAMIRVPFHYRVADSLNPQIRIQGGLSRGKDSGVST